MKIDPHPIKIRDLVDGYIDDSEGGVVGFGGKLNIRPPYQREFVYQPRQRDEVIQTVFKNYPLNVLYWVVAEDGSFELLDGQQRTVSISQYAAGDFSIDLNGKRKAFQNLTTDEREAFLDYELLVYRCEDGKESDKLGWFEVINTAGEKLTPQELLNAIYTGPWLTDAKSKFSKTGGPAYGLAEKYLTGQPIRQAYLETALKWISSSQIAEYMSAHHKDADADALWSYFRDVIEWVDDTFTTYRSHMKGFAWGPLYDQFKDQTLDPAALEAEIVSHMQDDEVEAKKGIYSFVLTRDEKYLSLRQFSTSQRRSAYERQSDRCANGTKCKTPGNPDGQKVFEFAEMDADHIVPWSKGGKTVPENCQMLCIACNRSKGDL